MNPCGEEYGKIVWKICNYASEKGSCSDASMQLLPQLWCKAIRNIKKTVKKSKFYFIKKFKTKFNYKISCTFIYKFTRYLFIGGKFWQIYY